MWMCNGLSYKWCGPAENCGKKQIKLFMLRTRTTSVETQLSAPGMTHFIIEYATYTDTEWVARLDDNVSLGHVIKKNP